MKRINFKLIFILVVVGLAAALLAACANQLAQAQPQVIVVTATSTPTSAIGTPTPKPIATPASTPTPTIPPAVSYSAGALLKGSDDGVFYLTQAGTRLHIYDWDTFLAFGFAQNNIMLVSDEALAAMPLTGELTRLVSDEQGDLYWVAAGQRWRVNEWRAVVSRPTYEGAPITQADKRLLAALPARDGFENGMLLREGKTVYYFDRPANVTSTQAGVYARIIPITSAIKGEVIDVPAGVLAAYELKSGLTQTNARLIIETSAANLRQGPGLDQPVLTIIQRTEPITAYGWTPAQDWLLVEGQGQFGWLAGDVVEPAPALSLLPVGVDVQAIAGDALPVQPVAVVETSSTPEPVYCYDTPIRGFGKVWGDHPEVQATLSCPGESQEHGTQAAVQLFEHGLMLWLQADSSYRADPVYVFFDDGTYQRFRDLGAADPAKVGTIPTGFYAVDDKFSKVYWEGTGVRVKERLGYAIGAANDTAGAYQQFYNGRMFWAEAIDRIFVIYDYYAYDDQGKSIHVRTWAGYEDTF